MDNASIKNELKTDRMMDRIVLIVLIVQIGFILYMNLFRADTIVDYDCSSVYMHEMEMGRQGKLFPAEYEYQSSMDLDSAAIISATIYHFTNNIFLSRGIANNLMVLLYIYVLNCVFTNLEISRKWKYMGILLFFIPYSMIMLGYWRMLFAGGGFFALRALVPLLIISLILDIEKNKPFSKYVLRALLLLFIMFLTGLSSSVYVVLSAVCPLILWEIVGGFIKGDYSVIRSKRIVIAILAAFSACLGIVSKRIYGFSSLADIKYILTSNKWIDAVLSSFAGIFELFGGLTIHEEVKLFSLEAIGTVVNFVVTWVILGAICYSVCKCIKKKEISNMMGYIFSLMFVNAMMFNIVDLKYGENVFESRYHIVPMLPSFILVVMMMDDISKSDRLKKVQIGSLQILILGLFLASMLYGDAQWVYAKKALGTESLQKLNSIMEDNGINTAFIVGDDNKVFGRKLRVYGKDTRYIVLSDGANSARQTYFGGTTRYLDNSMHKGKIGVITSSEAYKTLPNYLVKDMEYFMDYDGLQIYLADESRFDCLGGLVASKDMVIDLPYSPGYTFDNAELTDDGTLVMKEGIGSLNASYDSVEGKWEYTVYYEMNGIHGDGYASVKVGDDEPVLVKLDPSSDHVTTDTISMTEGKKVDFSVNASSGTKIKRIEMVREQ